MKKESGLPIYRRVEINKDGQEKPIRERGIGNDWNLGEEIQAERLDILQLTFLMEQLREHLPIIRDWANATEYKQKALDAQEQIRRQEVFAEILNHYEYFNDVRSRDFRRSLVTFDQLQQDPIFQIRAQRLLDLIQGEGLMKELEKRLDTLTLGLEQKESYEHDLVPSEYFDPNVYTQDMVAESASHLAVDIEMYIEQKYGNKRYAKEVHAVVAFIHNVVENGMFHEDGIALNENFSLLSIKQKDPRAWQALQTLIHEAGGQEILRMILGKPTIWEDTSGVVKKTGRETNEEREQEMFLRLGNPLHMALARSVENLSEGENTDFKSAQKEALQELYGTLPEELEFDLESHMLSLEVRLIMEKMNFESPEKAYEFETLYRIFLDLSKTKWGKAKKIEKFLEVPIETWKSFLQRLFIVSYSVSGEKQKQFYFEEEEFVYFQKVIFSLIEFLQKEVGFKMQRSLFDSRKTKWPLLRSFFSGSHSPDARNFDIEQKVREMREKEKHCLETTYTFLSEINQLCCNLQKQFSASVTMAQTDRDKFFQIIRSVNKKYISQVCTVKWSLKARAQCYAILDAASDSLTDNGDYENPFVVPENSNVKSLANSDLLCNFRGWYLANDTLSGLDLRNMDFRGSYMESASLGGEEGKTISDCNFAGAVMTRARIQAAAFEECDFTGTDLHSAVIGYHNPKGFFGANYFRGCSFDQTNLRSARFCGVKIIRCHGDQTSFIGAEITGTQIENSQFQNPNCERTKFIGSTLSKLSFEGGNFNQSTFAASSLEDSEFRDCAFNYEVDMENMKLENCIFEVDEFDIDLKSSFHWKGGRLSSRGPCIIRREPVGNLYDEFKDLKPSVYKIENVNFFQEGANDRSWFLSPFLRVEGGSFTNVNLRNSCTAFPDFDTAKNVVFQGVHFSFIRESVVNAKRNLELTLEFPGCKWIHCTYIREDETIQALPEIFS